MAVVGWWYNSSLKIILLYSAMKIHIWLMITLRALVVVSWTQWWWLWKWIVTKLRPLCSPKQLRVPSKTPQSVWIITKHHKTTPDQTLVFQGRILNLDQLPRPAQNKVPSWEQAPIRSVQVVALQPCAIQLYPLCLSLNFHSRTSRSSLQQFSSKTLKPAAGPNPSQNKYSANASPSSWWRRTPLSKPSKPSMRLALKW